MDRSDVIVQWSITRSASNRLRETLDGSSSTPVTPAAIAHWERATNPLPSTALSATPPVMRTVSSRRQIGRSKWPENNGLLASLG